MQSYVHVCMYVCVYACECINTGEYGIMLKIRMCKVVVRLDRLQATIILLEAHTYIHTHMSYNINMSIHTYIHKYNYAHIVYIMCIYTYINTVWIK